jgi:ribosome assembly protein RRB1
MRLQTNPDFMEAEEEAKGGPQREVWKGDSRRLKPDEELVFENKAYDVFYRTSVEWPCLSLDLLSDGSTPDPKAFPYSVGVVSGSQAADGKNVVYFLKFSELYKTKNDDPSSSESEDDLNNSDLDGGDPVLESYTF